MTSILGTQSIQHPNGTASATVSADGTFSSPGHVIQTVTMNQAAQVQSAFTTSTDLFSKSITPKFSSSKILIIGNIAFHSDDADSYFSVTLNRDSTSILTTYSAVGYLKSGGERTHGPIHHVDSPNTTSSTTYKMSIIRNSGSGTIRANFGNYGSFTLMEIAQ